MKSSSSKSSKRSKKSNHQHNSNLSSFFHESSTVNNFAFNSEFALFYDTNFFNNIIFDLFHNIFERIRKTRSKITQNNSITSFITNNQKAFNLLRQKHSDHLSTFFNFSKSITFNCIREKIVHFHKAEHDVVENFVCCSCDIIVFANERISLNSNNFLFLILNDRMNVCVFVNNIWSCCHFCHKSLLKNKTFVFSIMNMINVIMCDEYFSYFANLFITKECLITRSYSLNVILRLRSNDEQKHFIKYFVIREHIIIFFQNSELLSRILSNLSLQLNEKIKVIWINKRVFTRDDIWFYVMIKKRKIWKAFQWLFVHNTLYKDIHIDLNAMKKWKEEHISFEFEKNLMHISQSDHHEREEYAANIKTNNLKNELQAFTLNQDDFYNTNSILSDIIENKQDFTIFILNELHDFLQDNTKNIDIDNEKIYLSNINHF